MFVLRYKNTLEFICLAKTLGDLKNKINKSYWSWRSCQSKGSNPSIDEYMVGKTISKLTIKDVNIEETEC